MRLTFPLIENIFLDEDRGSMPTPVIFGVGAQLWPSESCGEVYSHEPTENALKGVLTEYAEKILEASDTLNQALSEIRRDIHIQVLTSNTKIESSNNKIDALLNHINGEVPKPNNKVRNPKKV